MRSSTWRALGNTYRIVEAKDRLSTNHAVELAAGVDGVLEVVSTDGSDVRIVIWNPDGSKAELSGNGTRIAAAWHAARTGARAVRVLVGEREVRARILDGGDVEQDLGEVVVGEPEEVAGVRLVPVSVGNPHAVVLGDPREIERVGPLLESHPRFPNRTNVQVARVDAPGEVTARVWERGVGETQSSGTSAVAVAAATHGEGAVLVHFPGGDLRVALSGGRASLTGPVEQLRVPRQILVYLHRVRDDASAEVLLLRRTPMLGGFWQGVTGAPEWDESDEEGAGREVHEETGLDVAGTLRSLGVRFELRASEFEDADAWESAYGPGVEAVPEEVYAAEAPSGWDPVLAPGEHDAFRWVTFDEALWLLRYESNREALRAVRAWLAEDDA